MKIFIACPSFAVHGGIRVILEWANRLSKNHTVHLRMIIPSTSRKCTWFNISPSVKIVHDDSTLSRCDCLIITSPHSIHYQNHKDCPKKVFIFAQALEHLLQPSTPSWLAKSKEWYLSKHPMFYISEWGGELMRQIGRTGEMIYIGNGVNFDHFPIEKNPTKTPRLIVIEGWSNHTVKDPSRILPKVAKKLKEEGFHVMVYSAKPPIDGFDCWDEFYISPALSKMNELLRSAQVMVKASRYDARPCAPMEAMTKGTPTICAKINGYDDLVHMGNSFLCDYKEHQLLNAIHAVFSNGGLIKKLGDNCLEYIQKYNWDYWMKIVEDRICA